LKNNILSTDLALRAHDQRLAKQATGVHGAPTKFAIQKESGQFVPFTITGEMAVHSPTRPP